MSSAQQKHLHDSGFWKTFLRAVAANLEHALILFTWDASCKACCSMWIFLCVSPTKNVCSAPAGGLEWIWEHVQKMVGGCVAWVKGSGWKSLSDEGIQRKDDASAHPGQSRDRGREEAFVSTGCLKMLTQICNAAVVGFLQHWLHWQQLSRKWLVQHEPSIKSLPGWWTNYLEVSEAWWLDWEFLPTSSSPLLCNF